jgi:hypothetical protein
MSIELQFKSTTFFPKAKENELSMTKQQQCIHSGMPVFAKDIMDGGKKSYFACGYEHFCNVMYRNPNLRHVYELLQYDKPSKIYVDFDCSDVSKQAQFHDEMNKYCGKMLELIGEDVPVYVLDATTDKKLSCHIIFECFVDSVPEVQNIVEHVLSLSPCEYLDRGVYTRNRVFRLLYSYKLGKDRSSALRIHGTTINDPYNPEHVFRTMIQAMVNPHFKDGCFSNLKNLCKNVRQINYSTKGSGKKYYGSGYSTSRCNLPPLFVKYIQDHGGVMLSARENDNFISCIVAGKKCPWTDKPHRNNNQFFTMCKNNLMGFWTCSDPECDNIHYEETDMAFIWRDVFIN